MLRACQIDVGRWSAGSLAMWAAERAQCRRGDVLALAERLGVGVLFVAPEWVHGARADYLATPGRGPSVLVRDSDPCWRDAVAVGLALHMRATLGISDVSIDALADELSRGAVAA